MKQLIFISRSQLAHNLLMPVRGLVTRRHELVRVSSWEEFESLDALVKPHVVMVDWNVFENDNHIKAFKQRRWEKQFEKASFVLLYHYQVQLGQKQVSEMGFDAAYAKPFLTEELAGVMDQWLKNKRKV